MSAGAWTDSEHARFLEALEKFGNANTGNEWQEMAKFVGTRTHNEIKLHAHRYFVQLQAAQAQSDANRSADSTSTGGASSSSSNSRNGGVSGHGNDTAILADAAEVTTWTREEDDAFEAALARIGDGDGMRWQRIATETPLLKLAGRTATDVQHRFQRLLCDVALLSSGHGVRLSYNQLRTYALDLRPASTGDAKDTAPDGSAAVTALPALSSIPGPVSEPVPTTVPIVRSNSPLSVPVASVVTGGAVASAVAQQAPQDANSAAAVAPSTNDTTSDGAEVLRAGSGSSSVAVADVMPGDAACTTANDAASVISKDGAGQRDAQSKSAADNPSVTVTSKRRSSPPRRAKTMSPQARGQKRERSEEFAQQSARKSGSSTAKRRSTRSRK